MATFDKVKSFLRGTKPPAQLAEIEAAIGAAEAERAEHAARRPGEIVAKLTSGDPDAAARVEAIDEAVADLDTRLRDLRDARGELRRRIAAAEAAARKGEIEARPKRLAELRREYMAAVQAATAHAEGMAAALRGISTYAAALIAEMGHVAPHRFLSIEARSRRFVNGIAGMFQIPAVANRELTAANSMLGLQSSEVGARSHWTPIDHELRGMDDLVPFFDSQADAEAARDRLAARGTKTIVVPLAGGCFTLVGEEKVFGDRAAAEKAAQAAAAGGRALAIIGQDGGYVAVDAGFAEAS